MPRERKHTAEPELLALLRTEALDLLRHKPGPWSDIETAIPYLSFIRYEQPTDLNRGMLEPSMCLVLQGGKKILIGKDIVDYGVGSYVLSAIDMPTSGQVTEASPERPYIGLKLALNIEEIAAFIIEYKIKPRTAKSWTGAYVDVSTSELQETLLRLVQLLKKTEDIPVMSHLLKKEIFYRLLDSENGGALFQSLLSYNQKKGVNNAIHWIKKNYAKPLRMESLAMKVGMSVSSLHHRFKAITTMSPLQYQKRIRLLEARKLLLAGNGNLDAATVAFQVGYESPSQFSREYHRLFGAPPRRDMAELSMISATDIQLRLEVF